MLCAAEEKEHEQTQSPSILPTVPVEDNVIHYQIKKKKTIPVRLPTKIFVRQSRKKYAIKMAAQAPNTKNNPCALPACVLLFGPTSSIMYTNCVNIQPVNDRPTKKRRTIITGMELENEDEKANMVC